jgi:hypothetical protein
VPRYSSDVPELVYTLRFVSRPLIDALSTTCVPWSDKRQEDNELRTRNRAGTRNAFVKVLSGGLLGALRNITINSVEDEGMFHVVNQGALSYLA